MLNICIPVYNYNVTCLVNTLLKQCAKAKTEFRIFVFEDGSAPEWCQQNISLQQLSEINYIVSEVNTGRSAARNFLADKALPGHILFIDCDSTVPTENYIENYLKHTDKDVVCGGTIYKPEQNVKNRTLRYKYGIKREMTSAATRNQNPNSSFATNNFMISTDVLKKVRFREFLKEYGHEDSLLGYELKLNFITISHIDNPVIHDGIEENEVYLKKIEKGIENLILIEKNNQIDSGFTSEIRVIRAYKKLKKIGILWIPCMFNNIFKNIVKEHLLKSNNPCLRLLDLYKICYYCKLKKH